MRSTEISIEARFRHGKAQKNILGRHLRYLSVVSEKNRRYVEAGFNAVLNDFIAHALGGAGVMEPDFYLSDAEIRGAVAVEDDEKAVPITRRHLTLVHSKII